MRQPFSPILSFFNLFWSRFVFFNLQSTVEPWLSSLGQTKRLLKISFLKHFFLLFEAIYTPKICHKELCYCWTMLLPILMKMSWKQAMQVFVAYLPSNLTLLMQHMDQGILKTFKCVVIGNLYSVWSRKKTEISVSFKKKKWTIKDEILSCSESWDDMPNLTF